MSLKPARIYLQTAAGTKHYALDPIRIEEALTARRLPVNSFVGKANGYLATVDGPGCGYILLKRSDLTAIDRSLRTHSLVFEVEGNNPVTISNLHIYSATAISGTQSFRNDDIFLVELRDRREHAAMSSINKAYNLRTPDWVSTASFHANSLIAAAQYTWELMVTNIWNNIGAVTGSTLTQTLADYPTSNPDNFCFYGGNALEALEHVCSHTNNLLIVKRDGSFHVVSEGDTDAANIALSLSFSTYMLNVSDPTRHDGIAIPANVRVFFPKRDPAFQDSTDDKTVTATEQWHRDPTHSITVSVTAILPAVTSVVANAIVPLYDSLPALYNELGVLQNGAALQTQAEKRATEYVQSLRQFTNRNDLYKRAIPFELGGKLRKIHWYDFGDGIRTQVFFPPKKPAAGQGLPAAITEYPGMPDLSRGHLPFERWAVGEVYGAEIEPDGSGVVRVLYGTQTDAVTTTWNETAFPHEIRAHDISHKSYQIGERVLACFHRQTSRWIITKSGEARYGSATLTYKLCSTAAATINSFNSWTGASSDNPITALNPFNHKGMAGDLVFVVWSSHHEDYVIVDVKKHDHRVITDLRQTGTCDDWCIESLSVTAALEVCEAGEWETLYCNPCYPNPPSTSTSGGFVPIQTSTGGTSVPAFGCCTDDDHVTDLGIDVYDGAGNYKPPTNYPLNPLYLTVTQAEDNGINDQQGGIFTYPDPNNTYYYVYTENTGTVNINTPTIHAYTLLVRQFVTHPNDAGSPYQAQVGEMWYPRCVPRTDPVTGVRLFPGDDTQREWVLEGGWGGSNTGPNGSATPNPFKVRIYETGRAVFLFDIPPFTHHIEITGSFTVHSCNPFHATASVVIPSQVTHPEVPGAYDVYYPHGYINYHGPWNVTIELTE